MKHKRLAKQAKRSRHKKGAEREHIIDIPDEEYDQNFENHRLPHDQVETIELDEREEHTSIERKTKFENLYEKLSQSRKDINEETSNGYRPNCCIYRFQRALLGNSRYGKVFDPQIVSIGPYHCDSSKKPIRDMQTHKWKVLDYLINRTEQAQENGVNMEQYIEAVMSMDVDAKDYYYEMPQEIDMERFVEILLLDGCFLLELFLKFSGIVDAMSDDPIYKMPWAVSIIVKDLLLLENQIPFKVLEELFGLYKHTLKLDKDYTVAEIVRRFFDSTMLKPMEVKVADVSDLDDPVHLLDFVRSSLIPPILEESKFENAFLNFLKSSILHIEDHQGKEEEEQSVPELMPCATRLKVVGVEFRPIKNPEKLLYFEKEWNKGVIEIPAIDIDGTVAVFIANAVAFEKLHSDSIKYFTNYAILMDMLVNTSRDVALLTDQKIINNYYGTDKELASFFNAFGKVISLNLGDNKDVCKEIRKINKYYQANGHKKLASYQESYCGSTAVMVGSIFGGLLAILALLQTIFTILGYVRPIS